MNPTKAIDELIKLSNSINLIKSSDTGQAMQYAIDILKMFEHSTTNGDVIKAIFPDAEITEIFGSFDKDKLLGYRTWLGGHSQDYYFEWWNAPYRK